MAGNDFRPNTRLHHSQSHSVIPVAHRMCIGKSSMEPAYRGVSAMSTLPMAHWFSTTRVAIRVSSESSKGLTDPPRAAFLVRPDTCEPMAGEEFAEALTALALIPSLVVRVRRRIRSAANRRLIRYGLAAVSSRRQRTRDNFAWQAVARFVVHIARCAYSSRPDRRNICRLKRSGR